MISPAIVLVQPQLGENIGKTARAMLNFGLTDLRLVAPRDGWPNPTAGPAASGADQVLDQAKVFDTVAEAIADCHRVYATTVRTRDMAKAVVTPRQAASEVSILQQNSQQAAFLFGREASGLSNDDVAHAHKIVTAPVNPSFGSLNLAQAVILVAYELFQFDDPTPAELTAHPEGLATSEEIEGLHQHLSAELAARGYFRSEDRAANQKRTLRNLVLNADFSSQEVQTLRGIIKSLVREKR
ncbi:MAG: RNA methyltransferase [Kordiimonadaceae bacterium]|nr:RNA methyltransferase [Kordiimonadaceae bacterium]MBO6570408.1 RNA methyltransferase [Kordiimonadaceae bacterium]MBO6965494.1 RNA methyltransferase [Kordiimonadaceae bacterium]